MHTTDYIILMAQNMYQIRTAMYKPLGPFQLSIQPCICTQSKKYDVEIMLINRQQQSARVSRIATLLSQTSL